MDLGWIRECEEEAIAAQEKEKIERQTSRKVFKREKFNHRQTGIPYPNHCGTPHYYQELRHKPFPIEDFETPFQETTSKT